MLNISIVVVNFNSGPFLKAAVDLIQSRSHDYELIVIDNRSSDGSAEFLRRDERILFIESGWNRGFGAAANLGADNASGDYLLFLNPDAFIAAQTPERMARYLAEESRRGVCGALLMDLRGCEQAGSRRRDPTLLRSCGKVLGRLVPGPLLPTFDAHQEELPTGPAEVEAVSGACMMVKKSVHLDIGGFDEGYFLHFEDLDYCRRVRERGWMIGFLPDAPVFHYQGGSSETTSSFLLLQKQLGLRRYLDRFGRQGSVCKTLRRAALGCLGAVARTMLRFSKNVKTLKEKQTDGRFDGTQILAGEVLAGKHPVVLVFGARSDVGDGLCARLNALGLITVCVSRTVGMLKASPLVITVHPDLLLKNRQGAQLDVVAVVSLCPIWELSGFEEFLCDIQKNPQPWVVLSSTSVVTKADPKSRIPPDIAARLNEGEEWVKSCRNGVVGPTVIVRPTLIYGGCWNRNINRIKWITRKTRINLDFSFGKGLRSPIHFDDLAQWVAGLLVRELGTRESRLEGLHCVELSGSETLSFREMLARTQNASGVSGLRLGFGRNAAHLCFICAAWIPFFREVPKDFILRLERDFLFSSAAAILLKEEKLRRFYP